MCTTRVFTALQEITWSKTEGALRVRHKESGGERDTGVVAGAFFSHLTFFKNFITYRKSN